MLDVVGVDVKFWCLGFSPLGQFRAAFPTSNLFEQSFGALCLGSFSFEHDVLPLVDPSTIDMDRNDNG